MKTRDDGNLREVVVEEARVIKGVGLGEVILEEDAAEQGSERISGEGSGEGEDVLQAIAGAGRHHEDAEPARVAVILQVLVEANFALPTVGVPVGAHSLGSVVELNDEGELASVGSVEIEGAVGEEGLRADGESKRVLTREVDHAYRGSAGGKGGVDDELGQGVRVVMPGDANLREVAPGGRGGTVPVEEAVSEGREFVVVRGAAAADGGIRPLVHPPGLPELLEAVLDAPGACEGRHVERLAELEDLEHGERATVEGEHNLLVAGGEVPLDGIVCHWQTICIP